MSNMSAHTDLEIALAYDAGKNDGAWEERLRLWDLMKAHWRGDMGKAFVYVCEVEPIFQLPKRKA